MTKISISFLVLALAVLWSIPAISQMPDPPQPNPNGFVSGPHYNLNIIGKKADFVCPAPIPGEYGNVIHVPEVGSAIKINMESGKGTKFDPTVVPELQVTDACAFGPDYAATLRLPKSAKGYWVFARALAKPGTDASRTVDISPGITMVQDDTGNELWYLGSLESDGTVCQNAEGEVVSCSLTRSKGQSRAINVTKLFQWTGEVCYFSATDALSEPTQRQLCCPVDSTDADQDGIFNEYYGCELAADQQAPSCTLPYVLVPVYCSTYTSEWVFNIADFVQYFWSLDNSGVKLVQVRFYPIP
jgi:hypothetical protein